MFTGSDIFTKRISKEIKELESSPPEGTVLRSQSNNNVFVEIRCPDDSLYADETYLLCLNLGEQYPFEPPEVVFVKDRVPIHPHVYSNGHICLNILGTGWSPALTMSSVCLSIMSMLASSSVKMLPEDNDRYVARQFISPKYAQWSYHDDAV